jgi:hypothetical protein
MPKAREARYEAARRLINEPAASGTCADYIDAQNAAKARGLDREVDDCSSPGGSAVRSTTMQESTKGRP